MILVMAPVSSAMAAPTTYECVAQQRNYAGGVFARFENLIQPRMTIVVDAAAGAATVSDPLIAGRFGGAIDARLREASDRKVVVTWRYPVMGFNLSQSQMEFRASLNMRTNALIVTQTALSYQERFFARGSCLPLSG